MKELYRSITFIILFLFQVLVLNHIHLFNVATPMLYVIFILGFERNYPQWASLLWSFSLGLAVDVCANTPGAGAATMTALAMVQHYFIELFVPRDAADDFSIHISTVGIKSYSIYSSILVTAFCLVYFSLEALSFFNFQQWLLTVISSSLLTIALVLVVDNLFNRKA